MAVCQRSHQTFDNPRCFGTWLSIVLALSICYGGQRLAFGQLPPAKPAQSSGEVLSVLGFDKAFFEGFEQGMPLNVEEKQDVLKLLMRVAEFRRRDLERWAKANRKWNEMVQDPEKYQGETFGIEGSAVKVAKSNLEPGWKERYRIEELYEVSVTSKDGSKLVVMTPNIPKRWRLGEDMNEPVSATGILVNQAEFDGEDTLLFIADRIAWHPKSLLGELGMDVGLFDSVQQRKPLTPAEHECFYQLLAAVGRSKPGQLEAAATASLKQWASAGIDEQSTPEISRRRARAQKGLYDVVPLFNQPAEEVGKLTMVEGDVRRAIEILADEDIAERFGIRRYYELTLFTDDSQGNPIVCCVLEVPPSMPLGEDIHTRARVAGFFLKSWAYPQGKLPGESNRKDRRAEQLAPLIIGRTAKLLTTGPMLHGQLMEIVIVGAIVVSLAAIVFAAWRGGRSRTTIVPTDANPDFRGIDA